MRWNLQIKLLYWPLLANNETKLTTIILQLPPGNTSRVLLVLNIHTIIRKVIGNKRNTHDRMNYQTLLHLVKNLRVVQVSKKF